MKKYFVFMTVALLIFGMSACSQAPETWHKLTNFTQANRNSVSYKFLVSKFGEGRLWVRCSPSDAAFFDESYLIQVMDDGVGVRDGQAIGHGKNLQVALNDAAASYLSAATVRKVEEDFKREEEQQAKRDKEFRKKCCKP